MAPRLLFFEECSPNRILTEEEEFERNAFNFPITYMETRKARKDKMV
jgi:hypothetical protein